MPQLVWIDNKKEGRDRSAKEKSVECAPQTSQNTSHMWRRLLKSVSSVLGTMTRAKKVQSGQPSEKDNNES